MAFRSTGGRWKSFVFKYFSAHSEIVTRTYGGTVWRAQGSRVATPFGYALAHFPLTMFGVCVVLILASFCLMDGAGTMFQRLGALVIACGAWLQYSITSGMRDNIEKEKINAILSSVSLMIEEGVIRGIHDQGTLIKRPPVRIDSSLAGKLALFEESTERPFVRFEQILIGLGTAMAAFGDLFVNLVHGV